MSTIRKVAVLGGSRIPFARSGSAYKNLSNMDLMIPAINDLATRFNLENKTVDEVAIGATISRAKDWNFAREVVLASKLGNESPAFNVVRACATSLESTLQVANKL